MTYIRHVTELIHTSALALTWLSSVILQYVSGNDSVGFSDVLHMLIPTRPATTVVLLNYHPNNGVRVAVGYIRGSNFIVRPG